jgi:hypothetical protein
MLPTRFRFIWLSSFREEDFWKSTNQKEELPVMAMFVNGSKQSLKKTFHRCFLLSFISFGQMGSEKRYFRNQPSRDKICL